MLSIEAAMSIAIDEARLSFREGNHGFGAVILKNGTLISQAHDKEETDQDSTSHAEINAIKIASNKLGKDLAGCMIVSTHEPCPMCSSAIVWSGIQEVAYGTSIEDSLQQGRKRINITCREIFTRSGKEAAFHPGILQEECGLLYQENVRSEIKRLRNATEQDLAFFNEDSINRRLAWFAESHGSFSFINEDPLESAYRLLLCRFNIKATDAPIIEKDQDKLLFHSMNFCPTLEACKILDLDTRFICKRYNEKSTDFLIKQIDPRLDFTRNYEKIRPYAEYCEEMIVRKSG
jgi:tRNA(adenine34) deaminase